MTDSIQRPSLWQRWFSKAGWRRFVLFGTLAGTVGLGSGAGASKALFGSGETPGEKAREVAGAVANPKGWIPLWLDYIRVPGSVKELVVFVNDVKNFLPSPEDLTATVEAMERTAAELERLAPSIQDVERKVTAVADAARQISQAAQMIRAIDSKLDDTRDNINKLRLGEARRSLGEAFSLIPNIPLPSAETLSRLAVVATDIANRPGMVDSLTAEIEQAQKVVQDLNNFIIPLAPRFGELEKSPEYKMLLKFTDNIQPDEIKFTALYFSLCLLIGGIGSYIILLVRTRGRPSWFLRKAHQFELWLFSSHVAKHPEEYVDERVKVALSIEFFSQFSQGAIPPEYVEKLPEPAKTSYLEYVQRLRSTTHASGA